MPTAAQRQRAAAAAAAATTSALAPQQSKPSQRQSLQKRHSHNPSTSVSPSHHQRPSNAARANSSEEAAYSDEDSDEDEAAAAFEMDSQELWIQNYCATCDCLIEPGQGVGTKKEEEATQSPTINTNRNSLPSGLKSKTGTIKARPVSSEGASNSNMKRTHSAGKLHAVGAAGLLGPHKRTGSAAGRLNALSELRPTTKLNGEVNKLKGNGGETGPGKRSPALSRRNSGVSEKSGSGNGATSANSSCSASPVSPAQGLPRLKKGRSAIAMPHEDEIDEVKAKSTPALYCSERCQQIDEQRSSGLGELVYYLHQPASPPSTWNVNAAGSASSYNSWSSRNLTLGNQNRNNAGTPESECTCPECTDKYSASGTVPSGASDTTESSASYPNGHEGRKQRTQSGRIMTPQNLVAPGGNGSDYFGIVGPNSHRKSVSKGTSQRSALGLDSISQTGTEGSGLSSESAISEMWEPKVRPARQDTMRSPKSTRQSRMSIASEEAYGTATTTGTVTPAGTVSSPQRSESPSVWSSTHGISLSQTASSPLRLLRQGDLHSQPSVDLSSSVAQSPQPYPSSLLSRSLASEYTEMAASSGVTLAGVTTTQSTASPLSSSLLERRRETSESAARLTPLRMSDSPAPIESKSTSALGTLKNAHRAMNEEANNQANKDDRRQSTGSNSSWLRSSISSAWNSLRGLPPSSSSLDRINTESLQDESRRNSSSGSSTHSRNSFAVAGLAPMTMIDTSGDPTPKQSQITRPKTTRGDIPAFANEIGHSGIPGEDYVEATYSPLHEEHLSKSLTSAHGSLDEERRRRRSEKERAQRHQRSKDVTVLPPLLGVSRTTSSANLNTVNKPPISRSGHSLHSSSASLIGMGNNRTRAGSYGQGVHSGSYGALNGLTRPTTPGLRPNQNGGASNTPPIIELGSSPSRLMSVGSLGTSPRRAGLGWGAMTAIASPDATQTTFAPIRPAAHGSHRSSQQQQHHHHHHHHHHHRHQQQGNNTRLHHRSSGSSGSNNNLIVLGNIGLLGSHPHGHGPVYGRHATTPVRSTTPRVPEDGGEMSGAALKGEEEEKFEQRRGLPQRRSFAAPPSRPRSSLAMRGHADTLSPVMKRTSSGLGHGHNPSSEDVQPVKMYPVLDIPNRQPTHDRYDANWLLDGAEGVTGKDTETPPPSASQRKPVEGQDQSSHRKRLFYFDTT